jgi:thioredoxin reductase (NADPH)
VPTSVASPRLDDELFARLQSYGTPQEIHRGDVLFRPGDEDADLIVVARGSVEVVRTATADVPAATVAVVDAGGFVGELNLLTGQNVYLLCRVRGAGTVYRVSPERLRQLMATDVELSDIVFKALIARRELLQRSTAALAVEIVGGARSAAALALRTYAARQRLIHLWFDADTPAGRAMMESSGLTEDDLPAVVMPGTTLKQATPGALAEKLGLSYRRSSTKPVDVTIVGAGPAGLAAAVYGASEGLDTVLLDAVGAGGQAAASSRIENYFGFPFGLSGADLTGLAVLQALKFGAQLASPCQAVKLDTDRVTPENAGFTPPPPAVSIFERGYQYLSEVRLDSVTGTLDTSIAIRTAVAVSGRKAGSSAKVESSTRRLMPECGTIGFMFVLFQMSNKRGPLLESKLLSVSMPHSIVRVRNGGVCRQPVPQRVRP